MMKKYLVVLLLAGGGMMAGCGPRVTAFQCRDAANCDLQTDLCHNSCANPGAVSGCADCCRENQKKCHNCDETAVFNQCH
jgi:hypothetical protein